MTQREIWDNASRLIYAHGKKLECVHSFKCLSGGERIFIGDYTIRPRFTRWDYFFVEVWKTDLVFSLRYRNVNEVINCIFSIVINK